MNGRRRPNAQIRACRKTNFLKKNKKNPREFSRFLWVELPPAKNREFHLLTGVKASLWLVLNGFRLLAGQFFFSAVDQLDVRLGGKKLNKKAQPQDEK